ncbi:MAG: transcription-repair coupling factor [Eubacteriales bacterium]|nr:transcription-repair coupling factor [Eubacteriales bacterium]
MKAFMEPLTRLGEFPKIQESLERGRGMTQVQGCLDSQKAHFIYGAGEHFPFKVILTYSELRAKEIYDNYRFFDKDVCLFPARDLIFYSADIHSNLIVEQRIRVMKAILERRELTVITTMGGCMDHLIPLEEFQSRVVWLEGGSTLNLAELQEKLVDMGYERTAQVEGSGQFAVRGGIVDIFPLTEENPVRVELWGDEVDSIRSFDVESQRSIENLDFLAVYPACEVAADRQRIARGISRMEKDAKKAADALQKAGKTEEAGRLTRLMEETRENLEEVNQASGLEIYIDYLFDRTVGFPDYFKDKKTLFVLDEPNRLFQEGQAIEAEFRESMSARLEKGYLLPGQMGVLYSAAETATLLQKGSCLGFCTLESARAPWKVTAPFGVDVRAVNPYNNSFELLVKDLKTWKKDGYQVILLSGSRTRAARLAQDLRENDLNSFYTEDLDRVVAPGEVLVAHGNVHRGYEYPLLKFVVISESDIFGKEKKKKKKPKTYEGRKIQSFSELSVGDFVVHENHGLGIYKGIEKINVDGISKDYMKIEYAGGSNLYILATQLDVIQKYAGAEAKAPKLNKLGTQEWNKTKTRVRTAVKEIAQDLVKLYAARQKENGYVYGPDTIWQKEFEEAFPYEETDDQLLAIEATKKDMESRKIMDRLICGDVGYGKTEIAIRAAFKAVQESKQVVFLVPTTILAQQHYNNFVQRMKDFPVRIDLLCRFRTAKEQAKTLADLKKGQVDIVIGTHRVLSKDVQFKDLGLLVIDEEQRFGVTHKEKIKRLRENVDVLTLTATPIPRTLHMSLVGIRDMSVLEEAPQERVPIQTYVMEYNEEMVREAISRELARGGQVYYVYNRVNTIVEVTNMVAKLVPEANVAFAHGQMKERELERIMYDFINGEIDVLVSTTIIETGLDISNVNTMIIHDADNMGLSQLYQLRGRVGRSNRTAYAFLMYRRNKMLKEVAEKRLQAIREFTELGSGFKIAMRDLEIRGAGNLLGAQQHGHMEAVGYDLYCKMLNESVKELKGETEPGEEFNTAIDLDVDAFIPEKYIRNEFQKLDIYKRIAGIESEEEYDDMLEELVDRFGEPPRPVQNLLAIANLKAMAHRVWLTEVAQKGETIRFTLFERAKVDPAGIEELVRVSNGKLKFTVEANPYFAYSRPRKGKEREDVLRTVREVLEKMELHLGKSAKNV